MTLLALLIARGRVRGSLYSAPCGDMTTFWPIFWRHEAGHSRLLRGLRLGAEPDRLNGGLLLVAATLGYVLAGSALAGWLVPHSWWAGLGPVSTTAALSLLLLLPHPWPVVGVALSPGTVRAVSVHRPPSPVGT
jgi:hypothetical protein